MTPKRRHENEFRSLSHQLSECFGEGQIPADEEAGFETQTGGEGLVMVVWVGREGGGEVSPLRVPEVSLLVGGEDGAGGGDEVRFVVEFVFGC